MKEKLCADIERLNMAAEAYDILITMVRARVERRESERCT